MRFIYFVIGFLKQFCIFWLFVITSIIELFLPNKNHRDARFANPYELTTLLGNILEEGTTSLLLGISHLSQVLRVLPTKKRRELGNILIHAPTRGGKGLLAVSQLLTWPHSVIVNDIKGDLYDQTAGFRAKRGSKICVIDLRGRGNYYDPFHGRETELGLFTAAEELLFEPHEGENVFTQRAIKMLTQIFLAAKEENRRAGYEKHYVLPYVRALVNLDLKDVARRLDAISPEFARPFLSGSFDENKKLEDNKFLISAWESATNRLYPFTTKEVIRCFAGSDFTPQEIITSEQPVSVYIIVPESHIHALSPLIRLIWTTLVDGMTDYYDDVKGKNCREVFLMLDELGRTKIPKVSDWASTVAGRKITLWGAVQSPSQLDHIYGIKGADTLRDNCLTQLFYRPANFKNAKEIAEWLGTVTEWAHSQNLHGSVETSHGLSERERPLMTPQQIRRMEDEDVIIYHRNEWPIWAKRMDWQLFAELAARQRIPAPPIRDLPPVEEEPADAWQEAVQGRPAFINPDLVV